MKGERDFPVQSEPRPVKVAVYGNYAHATVMTPDQLAETLLMLWFFC
jgi:hypothetical protein